MSLGKNCESYCLGRFNRSKASPSSKIAPPCPNFPYTRYHIPHNPGDIFPALHSTSNRRIRILPQCSTVHRARQKSLVRTLNLRYKNKQIALQEYLYQRTKNTETRIFGCFVNVFVTFLNAESSERIRRCLSRLPKIQQNSLYQNVKEIRESNARPVVNDVYKKLRNDPPSSRL